MSHQERDLLHSVSIAQSIKIASRPVISTVRIVPEELKAVCPQHAVGVNPDRIDLGKCNFCHACADSMPNKFSFTNDTRLSTNVRDRLIVLESDNYPVSIDATLVRAKLRSYQEQTLRFYAVSDDPLFIKSYSKPLGDFNIELSASIEGCAGLLLEGALDQRTDEELLKVYSEIKEPKVIVIVGREAITALSNSSAASAFFAMHSPDLFVAGDPVDPQTLGQGINEIFQLKNK